MFPLHFSEIDTSIRNEVLLFFDASNKCFLGEKVFFCSSASAGRFDVVRSAEIVEHDG